MSETYVSCSWENVSAETAERFPMSVTFHKSHGSDLSECDAWLCRCGNSADREGFHPVHADGSADDAPVDEFTLVRCDRCGTVLRADGSAVPG